MEPIESSETSAYINTLTPGTYPKVKKLQCDSNFITIYDDPYVTVCLLLRPDFLHYVENFRGTCSPDSDEVTVKCVGFLCALSAKVCKPMCCPYLVS